MPTDKILELHLIKSHGGKNEVAETVIKPVEPVVAESVKEEVKTEVKKGMVEIVSADLRELEVSVGKDTWRGKSILVSVEMEEEVRRLLEAGGFYLKG